MTKQHDINDEIKAIRSVMNAVSKFHYGTQERILNFVRDNVRQTWEMEQQKEYLASFPQKLSNHVSTRDGKFLQGVSDQGTPV